MYKVHFVSEQGIIPITVASSYLFPATNLHLLFFTTSIYVNISWLHQEMSQLVLMQAHVKTEYGGAHL